VHRREALEARKIGRERIEILFSLAETEARKGNVERSRRYILLARRIGMRVNVSVGHRTEYCRNCNSYIIPAVSGRVRISRGRIIVTCNECGSVYRHPNAQRRRDEHR